MGIEHTRVDPAHGHVSAESPAALKDAGNAALNAGDTVRAAHMYTIGIDTLVRDAQAKSAAEWFQLEEASGGVLSALLSNRSLAMLQQGDAAAAVVDADHCCLARPGWPKGHLRLVAALEANAAPLPDRAAALARARRACPASAALKEAEAALAVLPKPTGAAGGAEAEADLAAQLEVTRRVAEDDADPRRFIAAGDLGAALALGAHGLPKDEASAERYLRLGASGGDVVSMRNLGHLLLQLDRPAEAAEQLSAASAAGDDESKDLLRTLQAEAEQKAEQARFQLGVLAGQGDKRARSMLEALQRGEPIE